MLDREAAFAVLNQETGPEIQSVYMTVAADLVLNQVRLVSSLKSEYYQENSEITKQKLCYNGVTFKRT